MPPQPSALSGDSFEADLFVKLRPYQFRMPSFFRSLRHLSPAVLAARLDFLMCRDHGYRLGTFFAALKGVVAALRGSNPEDIADLGPMALGSMTLPLQALLEGSSTTT